jgi:hypothetical protein
VIVVLSNTVLVIRYENGTSQIFNDDITEQVITQQIKRQTTVMAPDKWNIAFNTNPTSALFLGSSINFEFTKHRVNHEINIIFPSLSLNYNSGIGVLYTLNYFNQSRIGGAYVGGGIGIIFLDFDTGSGGFLFGLNTGYKFFTSSGLYFRTGGFIGIGVGEYPNGDTVFFSFKPDLTIGWSF